VALTGCGIGWWCLLAPKGPPAHVFIALRFIREAINGLFPFAVVGGDIIGARLLSHFGVAMSLAVASVLVDIFVQVVSLLIYVGVGVAIVLDVPGPHRLSTVTFVMMAVALPAVGGFFLALNFGAFDPVVRWLVDFGEKRRWSVFAHVVDLGDRLQMIWRNHRGLSASLFVHVVTVFFGAVEVWIAFYFMGHPVSVAAAIAIESIGQGGKAAAFMLPGGIGVQDGTLIAAAAIFGVPVEVALAMALIKRVPDLVLGIPSLVLWQGLEGRRLFARRRSVGGSP
jgi:putative membrane protein